MNFTDKFKPYEIENFGYVRLPSIEITEAERKTIGLDKEIPNTEFLSLLLAQGLNKLLSSGKISEDKHEEYKARVERELATFIELGFTDYILLVWRVCNFCEANGIMRDFGRGSAAGSLSFYCIGVTQIDPIKYGLFFERFISKTRAKKKEIDGITYIDGGLAPDVDLDVDPSRRHEVIEFLKTLYPNRLCKILNMSELSGKILIKEAGAKILNKRPEEMNEVSDMIPKIFGIVANLEDAYKDEPLFKKWCDNNPKAYEVALKIRNLYKNASVHASGYVISYDELLDIMPLQLTKDEELSSCYTMSDVSSLCIKLDILGSRCSAVVDDCCKQLGLDWRAVNVDNDKIIYDNLSLGLKHPHGIFQLEADCNLRVVNDVKPKNLSELSDVVAMARPGALAYVKKYVENKDEKVHPVFDNILEKTRYVCLYQEEMMQMSHAVGFTLEEAEILRRIVGKKKIDEVKEWKEKIYSKCKENGYPENLGDLLWKILDDSSKYSFNLSHSVSFAALSALTIYLKYKYPLQFFRALLNQAKNEQSPLQEINIIQNELHDFGIKLLPPSLIKSEIDFSIEGNNIRYGLSSLKGVSDKTIVKLMAFRKDYANRFEVFEAAAQSKINIGILSCLIQSGCLESEERSALVYEAQLYRLLTKTEKLAVHALFKSNKSGLNDLRQILNYMIKHQNVKGKPYINPSRLATLKKRSAPYRAIYEKNSQNEKLAIYYYEKQNVGYSYTYSLRDINTEYKDSLDSIYDIRNSRDVNDRVTLICEVTKAENKKAQKTGKSFLRLQVEDDTGFLTALAFDGNRGNTIEYIKENNGGNLPKTGDIVFIKGKKSNDDSIYIDSCDIQNFKIYTKLADLKNDTSE